MIRLLFIFLLVVFMSCNSIYKVATGFHKPKLETTASILKYARKNNFLKHEHFIIKEENYYDYLSAIGFYEEAIWLFDSSGNFLQVHPKDVSVTLLQTVTLENKLWEKNTLSFLLFKSKADSLTNKLLDNLHIDSFLIRSMPILPIQSKSKENIVKPDFYIIIPWAKYGSRVFQKKFISTNLNAISNNNAVFNVIFINRDYRTDFKEGDRFINSFELRRFKKR